MKNNELQRHINKEVKETLETHEKHLLVANEEMGAIKTDVAWIKEALNKFEARLDKLDVRIWWILGSVILAALAQIIISLAVK